MSALDGPVSAYMHAAVHAAKLGDRLETVQGRLAELGVSSLPVVDADGTPVGVISRTDLLRAGTMQARSYGRAALLSLPDDEVAQHMTAQLLVCSSGASLRSAAQLIVERHVHRLFVVDDGTLKGVLSTREVMRAISDDRIDAPISAFMSSPVLSIGPDEPVAVAAERLDAEGIRSLLVLEGDVPLGVFTQIEALEARSLVRETPVEEVMNPAVFRLEADTPTHRAAAQAMALNARCLVAVDARRPVGILTGIDFARAGE